MPPLCAKALCPTKGWLLRENVGAHEGSLSGQPLPQFRVESAGGPRILLDDALGSGFALLAIECTTSELLARELKDAQIPLVELSEAGGRGFQPVAEHHGLLEQRGRLLLVRPDRFVAASWEQSDQHSIPGDIRRFFAPEA